MLGFVLSGCDRQSTLVQQTIAGPTMGTRYTITLVPWDGMPSPEHVAARVNSELELVNAQMSTYLSTSELSRFNASQSCDWFGVSLETAQVVQLALQLNQTCLGAFDVTVGPLVDLWGFGPTRRENHLPSDAEIAEALRSVGSDKLQVRLEPPALKKSVPDLHVDLSAIAKGHGVDRLAKLLDSMQFSNYLIEIGGEVRTRGRRLDGGSWRVGIEKPSEHERALQTAVRLSDQALATSGDYRNFHDVGGQRYSHCIDPKTGHPTSSDVASASVLADDCATADALATGLMALGFERGMALAEQHEWAVMLIARRDGQFLVSTSPRFADQLIAPVQTAPLSPANQ